MKQFILVYYNEDWADEHDVPALEVFDQEELDKWLTTSREEYFASLGNSGDGWGEEYEGFSGQDFVDEGLVEITEVDQSFADTFRALGLSNLSLCDIFEKNY